MHTVACDAKKWEGKLNERTTMQQTSWRDLITDIKKCSVFVVIDHVN